MSKIIVRRQEYANNGTHANEIEAVVKENLIANTLSSATDIAPSVGLLKSSIESIPVFKVRKFTVNDIAISAGSFQSVNVPFTESGYTPVGIISISCEGTSVFARGHESFGSNSFTVYLWNLYHGARTGNGTFTVLFKKS